MDGRINLDITFCGTTLKTPVYVKLDAPEQMLLSEVVCRQLGIISYLPEILGAQSKRTGDPLSREDAPGAQSKRTGSPLSRGETQGDKSTKTGSPLLREETQGDQSKRTGSPLVREKTPGAGRDRAEVHW